MRNVHFHPWALGSVSPGCNEIRGRHRVQWTHQLPVTPPHHHRISTQLATQSSHTVKSHSPLVTQSYGHTVILSNSHLVTQSYSTVSWSHSHIPQSSSHTTQFYSKVLRSHSHMVTQSAGLTEMLSHNLVCHTVIWCNNDAVT